MKRFLSLVICLLMLISFHGTAAAEEQPEDFTTISTYEQLLTIAEHPEGHYRLGANIDMNGKNWVPIPFSGILDGNGYTLYNLHVTTPGAEVAQSVDGNKKTYETVYAGLFSVVKNAEIRNLNILGADVTIETDNHCFAAILTGYMEDTKITGCSVDGHVRLYSTNVMVGVGGVAGFGKGEIRDCRAKAELLFADRSEGLRCEFFMGAILACGNADMIDCTVDITGYASCWGYVHTGGMNGMFYRYDDSDPGMIVGNDVSGKITFFENNPDRRAYCKAYSGEPLSRPSVMNKNKNKFIRNELTGQTRELSPETCENPQYTNTVIPPDCENWGYTLHVCSGCHYKYYSDYTAPAHTPGEWELIKDATYTEPGLEQLCCTKCHQVIEEREIAPHKPGPWEIVTPPEYGTPGLQQKHCLDCGRLLEEKVIPPLVQVSDCIVSPSQCTLRYKESASLSVQIEPYNAYDTDVIWSSSDESVVTVDQSGQIFAVGDGAATITCRSADGFALSSCSITVSYSPVQWLIMLFLFGWIWY